MTHQLKSTALVAVPPETSLQACSLFETNFVVTLVTSLAQAKKALKHPLDVIAAATSFDESRMFDLLRYCKAKPSLASIPFIAMRLDGIPMDATTHQAIQIATQALGAEGYVDFQRLPGLPPEKSSEFQHIVAMLIEKRRFDV